MGHAKFIAVILGGGHLVNMVLGQYNESSIGRRHETTFEVETYLCGRGSASVNSKQVLAGGPCQSVGSDRNGLGSRDFCQTDSDRRLRIVWPFILSPFTSHTPLYTLLDLLSDADSEERKDLATSQSADDPVPVESLATTADYAMTRTMGRMGVAIYRGDDGNSVQFTSVERSRTNRPTGALVPVLLGSQRTLRQRVTVLQQDIDSPSITQENDPSHSQKDNIWT
ncbi:hypothetical protein BGY98DRAFT_1181932 [Russula aff. rugulosa BPL654]|nr:hypothetical protein BGY98DRAFT_1181932 [Russula aff. rugulosa BPL654]